MCVYIHTLTHTYIYILHFGFRRPKRSRPPDRSRHDHPNGSGHHPQAVGPEDQSLSLPDTAERQKRHNPRKPNESLQTSTRSINQSISRRMNELIS